MFCTKCGERLEDGSMFCSKCGAKIEAPQEEVPKPQQRVSRIMDDGSSSADDIAKVRQIIGKNCDYYLKQFDRIHQYGKGKFNWASFFLNLLHAAYRNVWRDWLRAIRFPLIAELIGGLLVVLCLFLKPAVAIVFLVMIMAANIWLMITQILFAKRFNQIYMQHVEQKIARNDLKQDTSIKRVILTYLAVMALSMVVGIIATAVVVGSMGAMVSQTDLSDFEYELDDYMDEDLLEGSSETDYMDEDLFESSAETDYKDMEEESHMNQLEAQMDVSDIFVSNWEDKVSWYSASARYYMIPYMEVEEAPTVLFTVENNTFNYSTVYYVQITTIEPTSNGGLVCSGPMFLNSKEDSISNGIVEITWDSWETVDYPSIRMTDRDRKTDTSMIADDYSYWGPLEYDDVSQSSEYIFPDSDSRLLTEADVWTLTYEELRIAKNEIYARHGRIFTSEDLKTYFESKSWYNGYIPADQFSEDVFNQIEKENILFIQKCIDLFES